MKTRNLLMMALIAGVLGDDKFLRRDKKAPTGGIPIPFVRRTAGPGRNDPCPCGKGKKYKVCCLPKQDKILEDFRNGHLGSVGRVSGGNILSPDTVPGEVDGTSRKVQESGELDTTGATTHRDPG